MDSTVRHIVALIAMAAVLVYTVVNYLGGRSSIGFVIAALLVIGLPMMNIIRMIIEEHNDK